MRTNLDGVDRCDPHVSSHYLPSSPTSASDCTSSDLGALTKCANEWGSAIGTGMVGRRTQDKWLRQDAQGIAMRSLRPTAFPVRLHLPWRRNRWRGSNQMCQWVGWCNWDWDGGQEDAGQMATSGCSGRYNAPPASLLRSRRHSRSWSKLQAHARPQNSDGIAPQMSSQQYARVSDRPTPPTHRTMKHPAFALQPPPNAPAFNLLWRIEATYASSTTIVAIVGAAADWHARSDACARPGEGLTDTGLAHAYRGRHLMGSDERGAVPWIGADYSG
ncbi:hypothetical protein FA95DRAFT_1573199 [Auriscalpium vulgare]|uniref:Uncharacterized protein n=1 Tax=Auriscalpium vulgare TaxID=40419 RepID=A0ACB8RR49_9AGAM|nr:hypothetical protein FA95DRAFT_1573199 [Auriscalpium vulgare]